MAPQLPYDKDDLLSTYGYRSFTIPYDETDLHTSWTYLETGVDKIMRALRDGVNMEDYMGLYTAVHNFCTAPKAISVPFSGPEGQHRGGQSSPATKRQRLDANRPKANLVGEDLYKNLRTFLRQHLQASVEKASGMPNETLLTFYISEWTRYTTAAKYNHHLFRYLNRHWVKRELDEGKKDVYDIYTLHLVIWKEIFFEAVHNKVMSAVLSMVEKQRLGEVIEQQQIRSIVDSFVSLGLDETDNAKSTLDVYRYYFERPFIAATEKFYKQESQQFMSDNTVTEYMRKAETRLEEERHRVGLYLHQDIMANLTKVVTKVLVSDHAAVLRDEFQKLLDLDRQDDIARMYRLLHRVKDGLDPLRTKFEDHVRNSGEAAVEKIATEGETVEPKIYIDALLGVHTQFAQLVSFAFGGDADFVRALDNACKDFVNTNKVCKEGSSKSPELLAKYADNLLKNGPKAVEENELEALLTKLMTVFKFLSDKDVFQKFYTRMLAKRLVHANSNSDEAEISMIAKLKEACGFEYTNKLQRMLNDMQTSKDLNTNFKTFHDTLLEGDDLKKAVDPSYAILGTGFWPLTAPTTPFIPPQEIVKTYERFQRFYHEKYNGRKLTWLWNLCKGEMKVNYIKGAKVPYTFQVSTYQMAIMLLFNDCDTNSYDEIAKATALAPESLDPSIAILVKAKVVIATPEGAKPGSGTVYALNYNFKSKKPKVNLNIQIKAEQKQEVEDTHKTIEEDRRLLMQVRVLNFLSIYFTNISQSAIVRIMKSRKKMKHVNLVQETISQLSIRFNPKPQDIKKSIDQLIEKEYLERLEEDQLGYLA